MRITDKRVHTLYSDMKKRTILTLCRYTALESFEDDADCIRILAIIDGGGKIFFNQESREFSDGDIFITSAKTRLSLKTNERAEFYLMKFNMSDFVDSDFKVFDKEVFDKFQNHLGSNIEMLSGIHNNSQKISNLIMMIDDEFDNKISYSQYVIKAYVVLILSLVVQTFANEFDERGFQKNIHYESIKKSINFINENLTGKITLEELAKTANMGKTNYSTAFKNITGMTVWEYILNARIELAACYLVEKGEDFNITDIAFACGFNSMSYFTKVFKKAKGKTPTDFKNKTDNPCF